MTEEEILDLVKRLQEASLLKKHGKATKIQCSVFGRPEVVLNSWKFNEWDYNKGSIHLPCNARGLFITEDEKHPRIVARGYDKFFNIDETPTTKWSWIHQNTVGPYEVTIKENGCIIFIGGLEDGTIVVCSKHSTGPREDLNRNHALAGQEFLERQLKEKNIDSDAFGRYLFEHNYTAVAEYCDDSFEEHILEYSKDNAGLYLHGLNLNRPRFKTLPMAEVISFANTWGFKHIDYLSIMDSTSLSAFLDDCEKKGHYNDKEIEGFVIRCNLKSTGSTFFFKFKFNEPYLMYRQWREVTRDYLTSRERIYRFKKHNYLTNKYLDFVIPLLENDPQLADDFMNGKGIIKLRKMFLHSCGMSGLEILNWDKVTEIEKGELDNTNVIDETTKFLLIPIATLGCGKTTVALTLSELFKDTWGHIQNDDVTTHKTDYIKKALQLFKDGKQFVVADKNNHQFRERKEVFDWVSRFRDSYIPYNCNLQIIALCFIQDMTDEIDRVTVDRVLNRGDNHQSIKVQNEGSNNALKIMRGFMNRFQPFDYNKAPDNMFDFSIDLEVGKDSSYDNVIKILTELRNKYGEVVPGVPDETSLRSAFLKALDYKPQVRKVITKGKSKSPTEYSPVYFSAAIKDTDNMIKTIKSFIQEHGDSCPLLDREPPISFKDELHITLCHKSQIRIKGIKGKQMWTKYKNRYHQLCTKEGTCKSPPKTIVTEEYVKFKLKDLIWDEHVVVVTVLLDEYPIFDSKGEIVPELRCVNDVPHITLALLSDSKKAVYAGQLAKQVQEFGITDAGDNSGVINLDHFIQAEYRADICINF